jgi:3-deoxy-D-manno-octulosonic-acid transferase
MRWLLYNILFAIGFTLMLPKFLYRMWRRGGYRQGFMQRLGRFSSATVERIRSRERVWVHAVSVGEVYVALRFIRAMREARPELAYVLTTNTSTGHRVAQDGLHDDDVLLYNPADFPFVVRRMLEVVRPVALVLTESEIWPNMIRLSKRQGVPAFVVNGRVSESSGRGYRALRYFFRPVINCIDRILLQGEADRERLIAVGVEEQRLQVMGTVKYDVAEADSTGEERARQVLRSCGFGDDDPVVVGGSTWPGEEGALLEALKALRTDHPEARLVLVPRHAERRDEVTAELRASGFRFATWTELGEGAEAPEPVDVLLVDTTGELKHFYALATAIFVGKSLTNHGGQNIIEPALFAKAIVVGPNMENFPVVARDFLQADALIQVDDVAGLCAMLGELLADAERREAIGSRAADVVRSKRGVVRESARIVLGAIDQFSG